MTRQDYGVCSGCGKTTAVSVNTTLAVGVRCIRCQQADRDGDDVRVLAYERMYGAEMEYAWSLAVGRGWHTQR